MISDYVLLCYIRYKYYLEYWLSLEDRSAPCALRIDKSWCAGGWRKAEQRWGSMESATNESNQHSQHSLWQQVWTSAYDNDNEAPQFDARPYAVQITLSSWGEASIEQDN